MKERTQDRKTGNSRHVHKRLRSAYLSLKRNMPYLWTWYDHMDRDIPNTNNALEGMFTDLKTKLRNHPGFSKERRKKFKRLNINQKKTISSTLLTINPYLFVLSVMLLSENNCKKERKPHFHTYPLRCHRLQERCLFGVASYTN